MEQPVAPTSTGPDAVERKWHRIRLYSLLAIPILLFVVPWLTCSAAITRRIVLPADTAKVGP